MHLHLSSKGSPEGYSQERIARKGVTAGAKACLFTASDLRNSRGLKPTLLAISLSLALSSPVAHARHYLTVEAFGGGVFATLTVYEAGESAVYDYAALEAIYGEEGVRDVYADLTAPGAGTFSVSQVSCMERAMTYWSELLGGNGQAADGLDVYVIAQSSGAASAIGFANVTGGELSAGYGALKALTHGEEMTLPIVIFFNTEGDWYISGAPSSLPQGGTGFDLSGTVVHELAHGLGLGFESENNVNYTRHLYDARGVRYAPGMEIVWRSPAASVSQGGAGKDAAPSLSSGVFCAGFAGEAGGSGVTFRGEAVSEVLRGSGMEGLPISGYEFMGYAEDGITELWDFEGSHIELERSLMSHQSYRNYMTFMEAELALFEDLGYVIDQRNFFGRSVYVDNSEIVNEGGYFARNAAGTEYLEGVPNTATLGIGLHVYGHDNSIVQKGDLLAHGAGGTGIRVDGSGNHLTVESGTLVSAAGLNGTGVLVAYGKEQSLDIRGTVRATGYNGVGLRLDFGHNLIGDVYEYRGSYIRFEGYGDGEVWESNLSGTAWDSFYELNLDGPLVSKLTLSGTLEGSAAALYISENAYLKSFEVKDGARITGDVISDWDPLSEMINTAYRDGSLTTSLTFGAAGTATGALSGTATLSQGTFSAVPGSAVPAISVEGSLQGAKSFNLMNLSSALYVSGAVAVLNLDNRGTLTVLGQSGERAEGTAALLPAKARSQTEPVLTVTERLTLNEDSALYIGAGAPGSTLISAAQSHLDGTLGLIPARAFYADGAGLNYALDLGTVSGSFDELTVAEISPTLHFELSAPGNGALTLTPTRAEESYARYARNVSEAAVGRALYALSLTGENEGTRELFAALDFSAADGREVGRALSQLSPQSYDVISRVALSEAQQQNARLFNLSHRLSPARLQGRAESYGLLWGTHGRSSEHAGLSGWDYDGVSAHVGVMSPLTPALNLGAQLSLTSRSVDLHAEHPGTYESTGLEGGLSLSYAAPHSGLYALTGLRLGFEEGDLTRDIALNGYAARHESTVRALTGSALAGMGYDFKSGGGVSAGPYALFSYAFYDRDDLSESGCGSALEVHSGYYDSAPLSLGFNLNLEKERDTGERLFCSLSAAYTRELLSYDRTEARFKDGSPLSFSSVKDDDRDRGLSLQGSAGFVSANGMSLSLDVSAFGVGADLMGVSAGLSALYRF